MRKRRECPLSESVEVVSGRVSVYGERNELRNSECGVKVRTEGADRRADGRCGRKVRTEGATSGQGWKGPREPCVVCPEPGDVEAGPFASSANAPRPESLECYFAGAACWPRPAS